MDRISTGISVLDRKLKGGLPAGTITCLVSPPASQCNPLFYALMHDRAWLYIVTYRTEQAVRHELARLSLDGDVQIEHVGVERPVKNMYKVLQRSETPRHVIVDTMNPLEATERETQYVHLLNGLKEHLHETASIALLHCTERERAPPLRETTLTIADVVWELALVADETTVENRLTVPKYRCTEAIDEVIKLDLGQNVGVDTSRNIA